ncbi:MAG: DUF47 domain-containing protein [Chloroflexi bacterium]|nr:MAG: hypothetical protein B6I35_02395 [Anaerolineaceae bacterium 4572_32.2]RLC81769.1 MAG: DUF47 domain-containing protein [Chloroflexota bacterium]RLC87494.1 MAG: DUF47 domain-containing protein [Chloroflexota bacterium]HEY74454.1 DUF47 family protein [Thermoflexia bacterium]
MSWLKRFLKPQPNRFIQLLIQQADYTVQGVEALLQYLEKPNREHAQEATRLEKEADEIRRILIDELNRTFVTPIDREDIHALSRAIDDVLDYAYSTIDEMVILEVDPNNFLQRMASLLRNAAHEIHLGVQRLSDHPGVAEDHAVRAKALENRVEEVYREALAELFHRPQDVGHIVEMLKLREIYRHLSNAADRGDEAANVLSDIVVKMT